MIELAIGKKYINAIIPCVWHIVERQRYCCWTYTLSSRSHNSTAVYQSCLVCGDFINHVFYCWWKIAGMAYGWFQRCHYWGEKEKHCCGRRRRRSSWVCNGCSLEGTELDVQNKRTTLKVHPGHVTVVFNGKLKHRGWGQCQTASVHDTAFSWSDTAFS